MVNVVELENIGPRTGNGVRQSLNFGMPDARKPHRPYVGLGSQPEVSDGHENVGFRG